MRVEQVKCKFRYGSAHSGDCCDTAPIIVHRIPQWRMAFNQNDQWEPGANLCSFWLFLFLFRLPSEKKLLYTNANASGNSQLLSILCLLSHFRIWERKNQSQSIGRFDNALRFDSTVFGIDLVFDFRLCRTFSLWPKSLSTRINQNHVMQNHFFLRSCSVWLHQWFRFDDEKSLCGMGEAANVASGKWRDDDAVKQVVVSGYAWNANLSCLCLCHFTVLSKSRYVQRYQRFAQSAVRNLLSVSVRERAWGFMRPYVSIDLNMLYHKMNIKWMPISISLSPASLLHFMFRCCLFQRCELSWDATRSVLCLMIFGSSNRSRVARQPSTFTIQHYSHPPVLFMSHALFSHQFWHRPLPSTFADVNLASASKDFCSTPHSLCRYILRLELADGHYYAEYKNGFYFMCSVSGTTCFWHSAVSRIHETRRNNTKDSSPVFFVFLNERTPNETEEIFREINSAKRIAYGINWFPFVVVHSEFNLHV